MRCLVWSQKDGWPEEFLLHQLSEEHCSAGTYLSFVKTSKVFSPGHVCCFLLKVFNKISLVSVHQDLYLESFNLVFIFQLWKKTGSGISEGSDTHCNPEREKAVNQS